MNWEEELLEEALIFMLSNWKNVSMAITEFMEENFSTTDFLALFYTLLVVAIFGVVILYYVYKKMLPSFYPNTFMPDYPILRLDLRSLEGRRRCYDEFCLHTLKRYQFEKFVGFRTKWFNFSAKKRLFLMHMDLSVYEALRETTFGVCDGTEINDTLNNDLNSMTIGELEECLGNFLRNKQEKAMLVPLSYKIE